MRRVYIYWLENIRFVAVKVLDIEKISYIYVSIYILTFFLLNIFSICFKTSSVKDFFIQIKKYNDVVKRYHTFTKLTIFTIDVLFLTIIKVY